MVKMVVMTVWIQRMYGGKKVKDQDVDEAHARINEFIPKAVCFTLKRTVCNSER